MKKELYSFDLETFLIHTDYPEPYGYQGLSPIPVCMSHLSSKDYRPQVIETFYDKKLITDILIKKLEDDNVLFANQYIAFDFLVSVRHLDVPIELVFAKYDKGLVRDTAVRERLLTLANGDAVKNPGIRYGLANLVQKYLDKDISSSKKGPDAWRLKYSELYGVPLKQWPQEAIDYPLDDVSHVFQVMAKQHRMRHLFEANEKEQTRAEFDLILLAEKCPRVDPKAVQALEDQHKENVERARQPFIDAKMMKWNKNRYTKFPKGDSRREGWTMDTKKLQKAIDKDYAKQGRVVPTTEAGCIKKDAETLLGCKNKALRQYGETAGAIKVLDGFLPGMKTALDRPTQRITTQYTTILVTGRTSSRKVNLQNVGKAPGARECFMAEDGHVIVSIDYEALEMFTLAQAAYTWHGATALLNALNEGLDAHLLIVETITGRAYEELNDAKKAGDKEVLSYRALAKVFNFGAGAFCGPDTLIGNMNTEQQETLQGLEPDSDLQQIVRRILNQWTDKWELRPFLSYSQKACSNGRRPSYTCPITGRTKALNTFCGLNNLRFQGLGADAMKEGLARVQRDAHIPGRTLHRHGVIPMIEVHDEIIFSGPVEGLEEWVKRAQYLMESGAERMLPDCSMRTEAGVCGTHWSKEDVPVSVYLESLES
jgi:hypothetical protein